MEKSSIVKLDHNPLYEKALKGRGGGLKRHRATKGFLLAWKLAGYPRHFKVDRNNERIWDKEARLEVLEDKKRPERARLRALRGEKTFRARMARLSP
jgi:hypothetical protein